MKGMGFKDLGGLLQRAQRIQSDMARVQEELKARRIEGTAGGGAVKVLVDGHQTVLKITIAPEAVDPSDVGMLEDLVLAAVNDAIEKARALAQEEMIKVTGGLPGLPGFGGLA